MDTESHTEPGGIPRPDITVAHNILLALAQKGRLSFKELMSMPLTTKGIARRTANSYYTALARLKRRRQIVRTTDHRYELTQIGEYAAMKAFVRKEIVVLEEARMAEKTSTPTAQRWDGKWRIAIFDMPESKRPLRDYLRGMLKRLGCREFQRSMWIYPHRLPPFVGKLFEDPQVRKYVRLLTVSDIDYDDDIQRKFKIR
ncbi:MAG TPA: hypothetical protein VJ553_01090 [Candidatus Paceibacterota bacterium]|nr:hypothetical protein [Candidatus Paceibacterota bacterium]